MKMLLADWLTEMDQLSDDRTKSTANGLRPSGTCSVAAQKFNMLNSIRDLFDQRPIPIVASDTRLRHVTPYRRLIGSAQMSGFIYFI
jgi:hypothetical protein